MVKQLIRLLGSNISATHPVFREYDPRMVKQLMRPRGRSISANAKPFPHMIRTIFYSNLTASVWHHGPSEESTRVMTMALGSIAANDLENTRGDSLVGR
jgi:hypothetical protein